MLPERALRIARLYVDLERQVEQSLTRIIRRSDPDALAHRSVDTVATFDAMAEFDQSRDPFDITVWVALTPHYEYDEAKTFRTTLGNVLAEIEARSDAG